MKLTTHALVASVLISAIALAGCTAQVAPTPPPASSTPTSSAAGCAPSTSTFAWSPATHGATVLVDYAYKKFDAQGEQGEGGEITPGPAKVEPIDLLDALGGDEKAWLTALVASAQSSTAAGVGSQLDSFSEESNLDFPVPKPLKGTYIQGRTARLVTIPFVLTCADGSPKSGTLTAADGADLQTGFVYCSAKHPAPDARHAVLYAACDQFPAAG